MDIQALLQWYPQARLTSSPVTAEHVRNVPLPNGQFLCVAEADLSPRERALLATIATAPPSPHPVDQWSAFLTGTTASAPVTAAKHFQVIHFHVRFSDPSQSKAQWRGALADLVDGVLHGAFTSSNRGYLLLQQPLSAAASNDLGGLLALLDDDFSATTHLLIGAHYDNLKQLAQGFAFETQLFTTIPPQAVTRMTTALIPELVATQATRLAPLADACLRDGATQQLIRALYHTQGNVRQAACELFVHRNTLLYRIDKFERASGYNLKQMDDLVYCYLLTLACPAEKN